ncbi:MAG: Smr/MutS family protein [Saprospiraceae bacterium]|nr:Smr/MutS family protein [Saprospiraceae bacterium]
MLFAIGTRVRFRYTGESGVITAQLDDGMLQVRLDSDHSLEIPAFEEDLQRDAGAEPSSPGAKFVAGKVEKKPEPPPRREIAVQYLILKPKGVQLVFEPMPGRDGTVSRYKAWLLNDTTTEFLFDIGLYVRDEEVLWCEDKLSASTALELGDLLYDDLNENPEVEVNIRRITTAGPESALYRFLKIRPKQFFNNLHTAPFLNTMAHQFVLFDQFEPKSATIAAEDLKEYTKQKVRRGAHHKPTSNSSAYDAFNVHEFAHFDPEIDLHIDKLLNGHAKLDKSEILRIQLQHFQRFLDQAIRLGVPRIFVIHGVGEGKLKDAIADRLRHNGHVHKFKNEYHAKYGYGATEVVFS